METLVLVTQYMFLVTMLGMAAATVFFWMERDSLSMEFRPAATVSGIYTAIAAYMYFKMHTIMGTDGDIATLLAFPTYYRYIDWVITTPLMLLNLAILLQLASDKKGVVGIMIAADVAMILFGYFGERYADIPGKGFEAWTLFGMGCLAWLLLLYIVYSILSEAAKDKVLPVRRAFERMRLFLVLGWAIYPIGFMLGALSDADVAKVLRELVYNFADLVNKVGLGLVAIFAARAITRDNQIREAMRKL
jgi:bacteriorhodopsin